jgi:hypothetical protein
MFETCEAKLGDFPALFGQKNKSITKKAGEIQI